MPTVRYSLRTLMILMAIGPPVLAGVWFYPHVLMLLVLFAAGLYGAFNLLAALFCFVAVLVYLTSDVIEKLFGLEAKRVERWRSFSNWAALYRVGQKRISPINGLIIFLLPFSFATSASLLR